MSTGNITGTIGRGFLVLLGIRHEDTEKEAVYLARKIAGLRVYEDAGGKMNLGLESVGGEVLVVSQFTLYGDCRKGRRPSFVEAARPEHAKSLYEIFQEEIRRAGLKVASGAFQQHMEVELINDGPVTLWLDTDQMMK
jgi:D-tyrosyl-tRNA(Tyr) deacylase